MELILIFCALVLAYLVKINTDIKVAMAHTDIANEALKMAMDIAIRLGAIEKSTHTVLPITQNQDLEKQFQDIMQLGKEDFDKDLEKAGYDTGSMDDLV